MRTSDAPIELRDWFAGQALSGLLSDSETRERFANLTRKTENGERRMAAAVAYAYADAMLAARQGDPSSGE